MTSTVPQLRPLGIGQLLDRAIRLYRRNFFVFIGIIALVQIPLGLLQMATTLLTFSGFANFDAMQDPSQMFGLAYYTGVLGSVGVAILSFVLLQVVATAALTQAVAGSYLGQSVGILEAYRAIVPVWRSLLGALLLALLVSMGLLIWFVVPCIGWLTGVGMLVFFSLVIMPLIAPVIVIERQRATDAIRRAWDLARRRFWWVLAFVFILTIFAQIIVTGPTMLVSFLFSLLVGEGAGPLASPFSSQMMLQTALQTVVQVIAMLIYMPLQLTAITLMYFDLRVRTEGFDLDLLAAAADEPTPEITTQAPPPEAGNWFTWNEMGYFALIELGAIAIYLLIVAIFGALAFMMFAAMEGF